tara:strand:- start:1704 stop:2252 length:549 start_codon:yes stop_codon:yes gene_type:complete
MSLAKIKNNYCPICFEDNLYGHFDHNKSQIEIFSCRHYTCKNCYQQMNRSSFSCPICRKEGNKYMISFGSSNFSRWNTLSHWCRDFSMALSMNPDRKFESGFGKIYSDLKEEYTLLKNEFIKNKKKKKKIKKQLLKKEERTNSRLKAVCKLCNTQCTSMLQLKKHINSNNCKKKQRSVYLKN